VNPAFIVMWRHRFGARWQVQPHIHDAARAAHVAGQLVRQFKGEAYAVPVALPEDCTDFQNDTGIDT
jgi:hypothetical protein